MNEHGITRLLVDGGEVAPAEGIAFGGCRGCCLVFELLYPYKYEATIKFKP